VERKSAIKAILLAADWLQSKGFALPRDVMDRIDALKFSAGQSLEDIESEYATTLYEIMDDYSNHDRPVTSYRNRYNRAVNDAFNGAVVAGWVDGGANGPIPGALQDWTNERISSENGFVSGMFSDLKELRAKGDMDALANFIQARAQGYTATLEGVYLYGKSYAINERPGLFQLGQTEKHCGTCAGLDGQVHPISWYRDNNYIPRQPGNDNFDCSGYHCDCHVIDPETQEVLL
jgi:hypothetical protein